MHLLYFCFALLCTVSAKGKRTMQIMSIPEEEKKIVVDMHNKIREAVARGETNHPKAANMRKLMWNWNLEKWSLEWAGRCAAMHRPRIGKSPDALCGKNLFPQIAENIYITTLREYDDPDPDEWLPVAIAKWANESQFFTYPDVCKKGQICTHYSQMIWADTGYIGCGVAECNGVDNFVEKRSVVVICSYGAGLSIGGKALPPYEIGPPCSSCDHTNHKCHHDALCTGSRKQRCRDKNPKKCAAFLRMVPVFCDMCSPFNYQSFMECRETCAFCKFQKENAKGAVKPAY